MATYPTTDPSPEFPLKITPVFRTLVSEADGANEQRRSKWAFPKYNVFVPYNVLNAAEMAVLWAFFIARKGRFGTFYIVDLAPVTYAGLYVATGDGATGIFDLPATTTSSQTIYVDGVAQTLTTDYAILAGGGETGADRVDFVAAPAAGKIVTCDLTGFLRCHVRFDQDEIDRELFSANLYRYGGIQLRGVAPV